MNLHSVEFDTLDDFWDSITLEKLDGILIEPIIENAVGVLITGTRALNMGDGYWGKPISLPSVRIFSLDNIQLEGLERS